jgi:chorismate mutase/prephenate dehydratase
MSLKSEDDLQSLRSRIDAVDEALVRLLAERLAVVREIAHQKLSAGRAAIADPAREEEIIARWSRAAEEHDLPVALARAVLREVLEHSRRHQQSHGPVSRNGYHAWTARIGYQGAPGAFSDLAIQKLFSLRPTSRVERIGYPTLADVFDALEAGSVDCALIPVENSTSGSVTEATALLVDRPITVLDEETFRIQHVLGALPGTPLERVRTLYSHPIAFQQCTRALSALSGRTLEPHHDAADAARMVAEAGDPARGAVCSREAAERYGLEVLLEDLADQAENYTRFLLVARAEDPRVTQAPIDPSEAKMAAVFTARNERGALAECLTAIAAHGLNLTRIESRPQPATPWEYQFLVEFEGHRDDPQVDAALMALATSANHVRVLGCFRRSTPERRSDVPVGPPAVALAGAAGPGVETASGSAGAAPAAKIAASRSHDLFARREGRERSSVRVGGVEIGGERFVLIAGPCSVESREQIGESAQLVARYGARILRGGAFKPRTSPYSFQGLGFDGLDLLVEAGHGCGLPVVTEVLSADAVERIAATADMLQVGARNMQNFALLRALGRVDRPVLLKRGMAATIDDLLHAAEYLLAGGNQRVVLCERGIRTFETSTRNTLDIAAIPVLRERTHLPILVDPSHAAGRRELVLPLALAATAAGADGLMIEVHPRPDEALSDKEQALGPEEFAALVQGVRGILAAQGRTL